MSRYEYYMERDRLRAEQQERRDEMRENRYEREHELKMEKIEAENARARREEDAKNERIKQEHDERLQQMQIDAQEKDKYVRIRQKNESIQRIDSELNKSISLIESNNKESEIYKKELEKVSKQLENKQEWIDKFPNYKTQELVKISHKLQLDAAKKRFERDDEQINAAINKTGQHESNIGKVLELMHILWQATNAGIHQSNTLNAAIRKFDELINRECSYKLSIEQYFSDTNINLRRLIPILEKEGFNNVDALVCEDIDEYNEMIHVIDNALSQQPLQCLEDIQPEISSARNNMAENLLKEWNLGQFWNEMKKYGCDQVDYWPHLTDDDLKNMNFKRFHINFFKSKLNALNTNKLLSKREKRILKQICFETQTWRHIEEEQKDAAKDGLEVCGLMIDFLARMHEGIKQSHNILECEITSNTQATQQRHAMIRYNERKDNDIIMNSQQNRPVTNTLVQQCITLTKQAISKVNVTAQMMDKFTENDATKRALTVAQSVEDCCMQIIHSQGMTGQCLLFASELLKMKPASMSDEANILWSTVNKGIVQITEAAVHLTRVTAQYFAFLTRFQHSFQSYQVKKDKLSFQSALRYIHKDCTDFSVFSNTFAEKVNKLSDEAMKCIKNCVSIHIGAKNFEQHQISRQHTLKNWLDKKEEYDNKASELDDELDTVQQQKICINAERARLIHKVKMLETSMKFHQDNKAKYLEAKVFLHKTVI